MKGCECGNKEKEDEEYTIRILKFKFEFNDQLLWDFMTDSIFNFFFFITKNKVF